MRSLWLLAINYFNASRYWLHGSVRAITHRDTRDTHGIRTMLESSRARDHVNCKGIPRLYTCSSFLADADVYADTCTRLAERPLLSLGRRNVSRLSR